MVTEVFLIKFLDDVPIDQLDDVVVVEGSNGNANVTVRDLNAMMKAAKEVKDAEKRKRKEGKMTALEAAAISSAKPPMGTSRTTLTSKASETLSDVVLPDSEEERIAAVNHMDEVAVLMEAKKKASRIEKRHRDEVKKRQAEQEIEVETRKQAEEEEEKKQAEEEEARKLAKKKVSESMKEKTGGKDKTKPVFLLERSLKNLPGASASLSALLAKDAQLNKVFSKRSDVSSSGSKEVSMKGNSIRAGDISSKPVATPAVNASGITEHQVVMPSNGLRKRLKELNSKKRYGGVSREEERSEFEEGSSTGQKRKRS